MKKILWICVLTMLALAIFSFAACSNDANNNDDNNSAVATYVGAYSKTNAMGLLQGVQVIVLYEDATLSIYCGFTSALGGYASDTYVGTYTIEDGVLEAAYTTGETERFFSADIASQRFRAQIFMINNMPNDDTNENGVAGLSFYEVETIGLEEGAPYYYAGTLKHSESIYAYCMVLNEDKTFTAYISSDGILGVVSGSYEIKKGRTVLDDDNIIFTYNIMGVNSGQITGEAIVEDEKLTANYNDDNAFMCFFKLGSADADMLNVPVVRFYAGDAVRPE